MVLECFIAKTMTPAPHLLTPSPARRDSLSFDIISCLLIVLLNPMCITCFTIFILMASNTIYTFLKNLFKSEL